MPFQDQSQRFVFDDAPVRGIFVNLTQAYQEVLQRHPYPLPVQKLLGQSLVAATLLSATLKYQGSLILQAQGSGPVSLLLAQANARQEIRGLANWEGSVPEDFLQAVGHGHLAITIDPGAGDKRYQGIVDLMGNNLAYVIENYFHQSEQLPTFIMLTADDKNAAGLLLQALPKANHAFDDSWQHVECLSRTLTEVELLHLPPAQILHRLFHQEKVRILDPESVTYVCRCSRDAMARAILTLGHEEAIMLVKENKVVSVTCEFCNKKIDFDRIDVERIFVNQSPLEGRILH